MNYRKDSANKNQIRDRKRRCWIACQIHRTSFRSTAERIKAFFKGQCISNVVFVKKFHSKFANDTSYLIVLWTITLTFTNTRFIRSGPDGMY